MTSIIVSAYNNGKFSQTGSGYGFRIKDSDVKHNSKLLVSKIFITLDDKYKKIPVSINQDSVLYDEHVIFTKKEIGLWFIQNGIKTWDSGSPPKFLMEHIEKKYFKIKKNSILNTEKK